MKRTSNEFCPICGCDRFITSNDTIGNVFVVKSCKVCGLTCEVIVGRQSPSIDARIHEWIKVFSRD